MTQRPARPGPALAVGLALVFLLTTAACAQTARRATTNHNANWNDSPYGMNAFHPNGRAPHGHLIHFTDRNIQRLKDGNIRWVRLMVDWRYLEPTKGQYYWDSLERVVTLLNNEKIGISACLYEPPQWAILPGSDWMTRPQDIESFGQAIATRFRGRIAAYEIDNEKSTGSWPKVAERAAAVFVPQLKAAYAGIKRGDPQAIVVMNGLWEFPMYYLEDMYRLGAKGSFDAVNIHYYLRMDRDPTLKDVFRGDLDLVLKHVDYVTKKYGDANIPIWFTEYGWPATDESQSFPVGEEKMAEYLTYFLQHAMDSGLVEKAFWYVYYLSDGMALWHERQDRKRPAWHAHGLFQERYPTWLDQPVKPLPPPPPAASRAAQVPNGDFETEEVWKSDGNLTMTWATDGPQSGGQFLRVSTKQPGRITGADFELEGGRTYEVTGYIRMKGGMADPRYAHAMIHIALLGEGGKDLTYLGPRKGELKDDRSTNYYISDTGGEWYQVHYVMYTPPETRGGRIILSLGAGRDAPAGQADFDNIRVQPLDLTAFDR